MATESEPVYVPVEVDPDGYLRVRTVVTQLDAVDVICTFLSEQDPSLIEHESISNFPNLGPVEAALLVLAEKAQALRAGD